ncbi:MAG: [citrate (pro-3S)-lyase] ligase [Spirochaetales bacterium]
MSGEAFGWEERTLVGRAELAARSALLRSRGLTEPGDEDLILGLFDGERLVATGALVGPVLEGIAVAEGVEGEGAAAAIVSSLIKRAVGRGMKQLFLFTTSQEAGRFEAMGFSLLASTGSKGVALLEWGMDGIERWLEGLNARALGKPEGAAAVVVNCNPFTLGHRSLIEYAASKAPWLYIFVVEEDRSLFPFKVRIELVKRGTADLRNVTVLEGGPYIISSATFPTYFIRPNAAKGGASEQAVELHAALDLALFRLHIAPALRITDRFVGTEPYCATTLIYNKMMKELLQDRDGDGPVLRVHEMPRLEKNGEPVSASRVRALIRGGDLDATKELVPRTTWEWLNSREAGPILEKIRSSDSRH